VVKSFEQWVAAFNKKARYKFWRDERFTLFYLPDKGICELAATEKIVIVGMICGEGLFWKKVAEDCARRLGLKVCGAIYGGRGKLQTWIRFFGYKIDKVDEEYGLKRYYCTGIKQKGWFIATEYTVEDGSHHAFTTWEVPANEI